MADDSSTELKASDFRVNINHHCVALGDDWSNETQKQAGAQIKISNMALT